MNTKVSVKFIQGMNELTIQSMQIDSVKITEVAGTLASKILNARANLLRYKGSIKGFSFNRKFDICLSINDGESVNISELFGGFEGLDSRITLTASAESFKRFADIIHDLVFMQMAGTNKMIVDYSELQDTNLLGA